MDGRRTRRQQVGIIAAIIVGVFAISIGFAAFSSTLNIKSSVTVNPDATSFSVIFSNDGDNVDAQQTVNPSSDTYGEAATITNGISPVIGGLKAKFTAPGQSVSYSFYAKNTGSYDAYLNYITFLNVEGTTSNKVCTASDGTDQTLVDAACNGISISVKVKDDEPVTTSQEGIKNHMLEKGSTEPVVVTITYAENSAVADGPFIISFGDVLLTYSSVSDSEGIPGINPVYDVWDGSSATALADLEIDEATKTVQVKGANDLAGVRNAVNSGELTNYNIVLNSSIDLGENLWEPIGISASNILKEGDQPFTGTFDGNGYTVKGLKIEQLDVSRSVGFFGTVFGDVTIKNLNLEGSLNSNYATAGGLIGVVLDNGDIVPNAIIENCNLNVDVTSADGTGGFIGRSFNTGRVTITNSTNNGTITSTTKASGFVALNSGSTLSIVNSTNNGDVTGGTMIGGFIGYADKGSINIKDSINNGNITSKETSGTAGGIAGNISETASGNKHSGTFENCINNGAITGATFAGGLLGALEGEWTLLNNTNNGKVTGINNANAGGIIGLAKYNITIDNNKNTAEVIGASAVGGIIGRYELQTLHSQYETYTTVIRNSNGGTKELFTGTAKTKGGVIAYQRVKADYKDLVTITIENSSMDGVADIALGA